MKRTWMAAAFVLGALALSGCAAEAPDERDPAPASSAAACACEAAPVVDPTLLAFLSMASSAHHAADLAVDAKDSPRAIQILERLVTDGWPGAKPPQEVVEVLADTRARIADLKSQIGDFDGAARDVEDGLALAKEPTHFRGRLVEMRGHVEERRAAHLAEKGDQAGAERAKQLAVGAYGEAMDIQEAVIAKALKERAVEKKKEPREKSAP